MKLGNWNMSPLRGSNWSWYGFYKDVTPTALDLGCVDMTGEKLLPKVLVTWLCRKWGGFMARFYILAIVSVAATIVGGCSGAKTANRPRQTISQNTICEKYSFAGAVLLAPENCQSDFWGRSCEPLWNPSTNVVNEALSQVTNFFDHPKSEQLRNTYDANRLSELERQLTNTFCQVVGVTFQGKKGILLNCMPARFHRDRREVFFRIYGDLHGFWSVVYLPEKREFTDFYLKHGYL